MGENLEYELKRLCRVVDQMMTAHAILRGRFGRRAFSLDLSLLSGATLLTAVTFVDPHILYLIGFTPELARLALGSLSVCLFLLSILGFRVDWKEQASRHNEAVRILADIKSSGRQVTAARRRDAAQLAEYLRTASTRIAELVPIPDSAFISLKAQHRRKVLISRLLDRDPFTPVWLFRFILHWRHFRSSVADVRSDDQGN